MSYKSFKSLLAVLQPRDVFLKALEPSQWNRIIRLKSTLISQSQWKGKSLTPSYKTSSSREDRRKFSFSSKTS